MSSTATPNTPVTFACILGAASTTTGPPCVHLAFLKTRREVSSPCCDRPAPPWAPLFDQVASPVGHLPNHWTFAPMSSDTDLRLASCLSSPLRIRQTVKRTKRRTVSPAIEGDEPAFGMAKRRQLFRDAGKRQARVTQTMMHDEQDAVRVVFRLCRGVIDAKGGVRAGRMDRQGFLEEV
jgi:hypothetical protein